ncbi:nucleotidyltransferase family protein [Francisella frigiditurris]|uniref:Nucleotidyltransferase family protein n=1 Tax=Francisella frigiditurris TaxID=1542390 RepID=A0A1J0KU97_9GAMM|nr:nucleotidyltransferase family protein [Francisella frigiditurris]APC97222.1 hypothetical protein KX01_490 [Francisella frigiditurris]
MASSNSCTSDITFQYFLYLIRIHIHRDQPNYIDPFNMENIKYIDVKRLFQFIVEHKLELIIFPILKRIDLPEFNLKKLYQRCFQITKKQLIMEKFLSEIVQRFNETKINNVVLKGALLDKLIYGSARKRVCGDIDILIQIEDLYEAHKHLIDLGFSLSKEGEYTLNFIKKYPFSKNSIKDILYIHKDSNILLELHWKILIVGNLKEQIEEYEYGFRNYNFLQKEYCLAYLVIHGYRSGWHRLKWMIDIIDFVKVVNIDKKVFQNILLGEQREYRSLTDLNFLLKELFNFESDILQIDGNISFFQKIACKYRVNHIKSIIYKSKSHLKDYNLKIISKKFLYHLLVYPNKKDYFKSYMVYLFYKIGKLRK